MEKCSEMDTEPLPPYTNSVEIHMLEACQARKQSRKNPTVKVIDNGDAARHFHQVEDIDL